jgi:hypothetical protein
MTCGERPWMARRLQDEASTTEQLSGFNMYASPQRRSHNLTWKLRKQAGCWLRELRENRGLSQRALAQKMGAEYVLTLDMLASLIPATGLLQRGRGVPMSAEPQSILLALGSPSRT